MGVTLQAGILAACVVFVPLGMAGMHLTRNRVLFFSSALFIVLAVSVHLLPYFPALSLSFYSLPAFRSVYGLFNANDPGSPAPLDCFSNLHEIEWQSPSLQSEMASLGPNKSEGTGSESDRDWNWNPKPLEECSFQRLESKEAVQLLQGTWIVVAGDSQARFFLVALLELLLPSAEPIRPQLFKRHSNYEYLWREEQMRLQFVWAPYSINLTRLARDFRRNQTYPDVFIMGAGLWHMLHATNASHYGESLVKLKRQWSPSSPLLRIPLQNPWSKQTVSLRNQCHICSGSICQR